MTYLPTHPNFSLFFPNFEISIILHILGGQEKSRAALTGVVVKSPIHTWRARWFPVYRWAL